ncbi:hypothetical protein DL769_000118 [Monosporascus sp. CRB-8-3]|nr:hypothetical protein DL769_000118 [Monosporascus sp. CRB-8-3]
MVSRGDSTGKPASTGWPTEFQDIDTALNKTSFLDVFKDDLTNKIATKFARDVVVQNRQGREQAAVVHDETGDGKSLNTGDREFRRQVIRLGLASLGAFLQANVTGPVLEGTDTSDAVFASAYEEAIRYIGEPGANGVSGLKRPMEAFRKLCVRSLDTDGVSVYPYIPQIELFGFARFIFTSGNILPVDPPEAWEADSDDTLAGDLSWIRFRVHLWHYKLLAEPSLGPGSLFTKSGRWTDVASLQETIQKSLDDAEASVARMVENEEGAETPVWSPEHRTQFYLEKANAHLMLGNDKAARRAVQSATENSGFVYALSGALGKRTRFQEKDISQLVVLAKSLQITDTDASEQELSESAPIALPLNDDTLLEKIDFKNENGVAEERSELPVQLRDIVPDNQPKLKPEDQIILLTEATLRDTFSPSDALTSEEILPFAVRVIDDKASNWQIYTQALLVRSRIELNRSRTLERAVLQMQAVVDQVIVDTQTPALATTSKYAENRNDSNIESEVPSIGITTTNSRPTGSATPNKPTSFLPAPKPSESASAQERLRYVNALASPPRWHLESELAYAWASVGSLVSATEIFKRLRLWAEVALCLASNATSDDDRDGRGSGGEERARAIVRWRLFHRTGSRPDSKDDEDNLDDADVDISTLKVSDFRGPERSPAPPNAPRLFCILGDLENDPAHYERAWEISNRRFARARRSLGELYLRNQEWTKAHDAYAAAVAVNRLSPEMWSRLGDIELRLGHFPDAAEAFQKAISTAGSGGEGGEDARTWSNLGSALLSWHREAAAENKANRERRLKEESGDTVENSEVNESGTASNDKEEETMPSTARAARHGKQPHRLLNDALEAFKRGATIANSNWRIWDNVVTLASSLSPTPGFDDVILGTRNVLRIRKTENALDVDILTLLVREVTGRPAAGSGDGAGAVYEPPRASLECKVIDLFENDVVPLLTATSEPWSLVSRLRAWRRDWAGALDAAEKGWRAAVGGSGAGVSGGGGGSSSLTPTNAASSSSGAAADWLQDAGAWGAVVQRTSELVAAYENYGDKVESVGSRWKGKARMSVRSVLGKGRESWEGSDGWKVLEGLLEGLKG